MGKRIYLPFSTEYSISSDTGMLQRCDSNYASTMFFYHAFPGDKLIPQGEGIRYAVATYRPEVEEQYIYTYCYQEEENWTTYNKDLQAGVFLSSEFVFERECYFRVMIYADELSISGDGLCISCDGLSFSGDDARISAETVEKTSSIINVNFASPILFVQNDEKNHTTKNLNNIFQGEIASCAQKVQKILGESKASNGSQTVKKAFFILTDSHYVVNGTWEDTLANMHAVADQISLDGVIHLGDFTDGLGPWEINREYVRRVYEDLQGFHKPFYVTLGNHDSNYFRNNPAALTPQQQYATYMKPLVVRENGQVKPNGQSEPSLYYYIDDDELKLRMFFLHSHDYRQQDRYGYSEEEQNWFRESLQTVAEDYRVLVFAHVPPLAKYHYWNPVMRGGEAMFEILLAFQMQHGRDRVLGWIHGHNHGDAVWQERGINVISLGCNKCEYFEDKKPAGTTTYPRRLGTVSQDLWDVLILSSDNNSIDFIRFGAGEDKHI